MEYQSQKKHNVRQSPKEHSVSTSSSQSHEEQHRRSKPVAIDMQREEIEIVHSRDPQRENVGVNPFVENQSNTVQQVSYQPQPQQYQQQQQQHYIQQPQQSYDKVMKYPKFNIERLLKPDELIRVETPTGLTWYNISYQFNYKQFVNNHTVVKPKYILDSVSGYVKPGKVLMILSPDKYNRRILLEILGGLRPPTSGKIFYQNVEVRPTTEDPLGYNGNLAYIIGNNSNTWKGRLSLLQNDDKIFGDLTVFEYFRYAASLKNHWVSTVDLNTRVYDLINYLGLHPIHDQPIGNVFHNVKYNSEQERISLGIELISDHPLIMLDEFISDSIEHEYSKLFLFELIHDLSIRFGYTFILTMNSSVISYQMYNMMCKYNDSIMLLNNYGNVVFHDNINNSTKYFADTLRNSFNYTYINPCNYCIDLLNEDILVGDDESRMTNTNSYKLLAAYRQIQLPNIEAEIKKINQMHHSNAGSFMQNRKPNNICKQMFLLITRFWIIQRRNYSYFWIRYLLYLLLCLTLGSLFWNLNRTHANHDLFIDRDEYHRIQLYGIITASFSLLLLKQIPMYIEERNIYVRERYNYHYNSIAYWFAHWVSSIPWRAVLALMTSGILYGMTQTRLNSYHWAINFCNIYMLLEVTEAMIVAITYISYTTYMSLCINFFLLLLFIVTSGWLKLPGAIYNGWIWVHYGLSFHRYNFRIFMQNEFWHHNNRSLDGDNILRQFGMAENNLNNNGLWFEFVILICMLVFLRVLHYVFLCILNGTKYGRNIRYYAIKYEDIYLRNMHPNNIYDSHSHSHSNENYYSTVKKEENRVPYDNRSREADRLL